MTTDCKLNNEVFDLKIESDVCEPAVRIMSELENSNGGVDQLTFMDTNDATFAEKLPDPDSEKLPDPDSEKLEHKTMPDSVDCVSNVQELPYSHAEPRADFSGPDANESSESKALVATASALPSNRNLNSSEVVCFDDLCSTSKNPVVNDPPESEVLVATASPLPSNGKLNSSELVCFDDLCSKSKIPDVNDPPESEVLEATASTLPNNSKLNSPELICCDDLCSKFKIPDVNDPPESEVLEAIASTLPNNSILNSLELDEGDDVGPHEYQRLYQRSLSISSDIAEDNGVLCGPSSDHCTDEMETDNEDIRTVVFYPDHMVYGDSYCSDCVLTFTSSCIKIEGSTIDEDYKIYKYQWGLQDILDIKSHWHEMVNVAMVTIHVLMEDTIQPNNGECPSGIGLKFAVIGTNWYGRQEDIASLNDAYRPLLSNMFELEDTVHGRNQASLTKYFPNFDQPFEEVIYPKGDVDAVSISKRDVDLLLPDTFVNDTIIDFYIKYLKNKIKPEDKHRFHFFNSFFFRKLVDPDKDPLDASQGKAAFQRVRKWTRKVNIFEKDFVFIPVNYNYHWSLIVICHLGEAATCKDEDVTEWSKVPCVLHMDSIRGSHNGLKGLMQSYLKEEWKGRLQEAPEDISSKFDNLRFISLELPQQPNSFDCGLFLLHYVELFLEQAPINFNPFKITKSVNFLNVDWFPPADACLKRVVIQRLVYDLLELPSHEAPSMAANDEHHIHKPAAVNFFPQMCNNPSTVFQSSQDDQGIEVSLLPSLSIISEPCPKDPSESLKPAFEAGSFLGMQFPSFNETMFDGYKHSPVPPIEEDIETNGRFVYSSTEINLQQDNEIPFSSQDFKTDDSWHQNINFETSPQTSISGCEDSLEVRDEPKSPLIEHVETLDVNGNADNHTFSPHYSLEVRDEPESPSIEPVEMLDVNGNTENHTFSPRYSLVERDEPKSPLTEPVEMLDVNGNADNHTFTHYLPEVRDEPKSLLPEPVEMLDDNGNVDNLAFSPRYTELQANGGPTGSGESSGLESDVLHPTKRMRMTEPPREDGSACDQV